MQSLATAAVADRHDDGFAQTPANGGFAKQPTEGPKQKKDWHHKACSSVV